MVIILYKNPPHSLIYEIYLDQSAQLTNQQHHAIKKRNLSVSVICEAADLSNCTADDLETECCIYCVMISVWNRFIFSSLTGSKHYRLHF